MVQSATIASLVVGLAASAAANPVWSHQLHARRLLGSSFGIPGDNATFDYVVVGGGTAGLAIATRLAEQQQGRVAVVEAGSFYEIGNGNISEVPATDGIFAGKGEHDWQPLIDWGYMTTPQAGAYDQRLHYARGKVLGGSSARNYMVYQRGTTESYQKWADAVGDQSYTFEEFLPYFEKSLKFTPPDNNLRFANGTPEWDPDVVGDGSGPLSVTFSHYVQAFATWAKEALTEIGIPSIPGLLSGSLLGQSYSTFTINATTMTRDSSETSFLRAALDYPNYMVYQSTMAKKILFDGKKATGVLVDTQGFSYVLSATKEVILAGGVFGSPQILMASGVGPASTLQELDIPVVADLPGVGQNLQDHLWFSLSHRVNAPTLSALSNADFAAQAAVEYNERAAGMYCSPGSDVLAWEKVPEPHRAAMSNSTLSELAQFPADWPELEYISVGGYFGFQIDTRRGAPTDGFNYASLAVVLNTPLSRGNVSISSPDTAVAPIINPNYFSNRGDVEVAIAGFKRAREFFASEAIQPILVGSDEAFPGLNITTDAQIEDIIKQSFNTIWHGACTCAMGLPEDSKAVVDSKARVYGVEGVRVVDASSFPFLPPGHPMATIYAYAEKIACDITGDC